MGYIGEKARGERCPAKELLIKKFGADNTKGGISAQYVRFGKEPVVLGISGLGFDSMAVNILASDDAVFEQFTKTVNEGSSILLIKSEGGLKALTEKGGTVADAGFDDTYGARPLRRAIQSKIEDTLSEKILEGTVSKDSKVSVDFADGQFIFNNK